MQNVLINWLEIPVVDMGRAVQFYERVFETKLRRETMSEIDMAIFPHSHSGGALVAGEGFKPSTEGSLPYLHTPALNDLLGRVAAAGQDRVWSDGAAGRDRPDRPYHRQRRQQDRSARARAGQPLILARLA